MRSLFKFAVTTGSLGVILLLILILTKVSGPIFSFVGGIGLILVFISLGAYILSFFDDFRRAIKRDNYVLALIILVLFALIFYSVFRQ